jgi:hypothetical protein
MSSTSSSGGRGVSKSSVVATAAKNRFEVEEDDDEDSDNEIEFLPQSSSPALRNATGDGAVGGGGGGGPGARNSRLPHRRSAGVSRARVHRNNRVGDCIVYSSSPGKGQSSPKRENNARIKELLLNQLDLIKKQSDDIVKKDQQLRELQRDNEKLKQRLKLLELRNVEHEKKSKLRAPAKYTQATETELRDCVDKDINIGTSQTTAPASAQLETKKAKGTKKSAKKRPRKKPAKSQASYVSASKPYFVLLGEDFIRQEKEEILNILKHAEVPGWRERPVNATAPVPSVSSRVEMVDDETYLKRHSKPEIDERRRKRWDMQRIREQRQIDKLKVRYEQANSASTPVPAAPAISGAAGPVAGAKGIVAASSCAAAVSEGKEEGDCCVLGTCAVDPDFSLVQDPNGITHLTVTEGEVLPVCAFGHQIPDLVASDYEGVETSSRKRTFFQLPWAVTNAATATNDVVAKQPAKKKRSASQTQ